jgi:predicted RNase H-like nuclease
VTLVAGVDGCPGGWVAAIVDVDTHAVRWVRLNDARGVVGLLDDCAVVGIDIPIGLPLPGEVRACDVEARVALVERRSCVFPAPPRVVLAEPEFRAANDVSRRVSGKGVSKQAFFIGARIDDVDVTLDPSLADRVVEVHPEVSFTRMAGRPIGTKKTAAGLAARRDLLAPWLRIADSDTDVAALVDARPPRVKADDALDALACAWSAERWLRGAAQTLPAEPAYDERGLPMRIVT